MIRIVSSVLMLKRLQLAFADLDWSCFASNGSKAVGQSTRVNRELAHLVIAPTRDLATAVLTSFNRIAKTRSLSIHPLVARLVDPEVLKEPTLAGKAEGEAPPQALN